MTALVNVFLSFLILIYTPNGSIQDDQLQIRMRRNWGYSSGTGKIQGTFTITASGPDGISRVVFYLDDQILVLFQVQTHISGYLSMSAFHIIRAYQPHTLIERENLLHSVWDGKQGILGVCFFLQTKRMRPVVLH